MHFLSDHIGTRLHQLMMVWFRRPPKHLLARETLQLITLVILLPSSAYILEKYKFLQINFRLNFTKILAFNNFLTNQNTKTCSYKARLNRKTDLMKPGIQVYQIVCFWIPTGAQSIIFVHSFSLLSNEEIFVCIKDFLHIFF